MTYVPASTFVDNSARIDELNAAQQDATQAPQTEAQKAQEDASLNFDTFLKLLTVQLQHQDPLNPMDGTAFTEQIATFSSLEQQINTNTHLEKLTQQQDFSEQTLAISYIGKDALIPGEVTATDGQSDILLNYTLDRPAASTLIEIVNEDNEVVAHLEGSNLKGRNELVWDSKDDNGNPVEPGFYEMRISSVQNNGDPVIAKTYTYGNVRAVEGQGANLTLLTADGREVGFDEILMVKQSVTATANNTSGGDSSGDDSSTDTEEENS